MTSSPPAAPLLVDDFFSTIEEAGLGDIAAEVGLGALDTSKAEPARALDSLMSAGGGGQESNGEYHDLQRAAVPCVDSLALATHYACKSMRNNLAMNPASEPSLASSCEGTRSGKKHKRR